MRDSFDVVVVGSGAGGGVVAAELAQRGRDVLLLETGPHVTAAEFTRWEAKATHDLWWPLRLAFQPNGEPVALLAGRCVGGTTTINTKVALRAHERDVAKWHPATGLTSGAGEPFAAADLQPYYDRVERVLGVRERRDGCKSVYTVESGFRALGAELEPVRSYTDANCMRCGSCLQGCPTNAGKSTMNTYIHDAWARGSSACSSKTVRRRESSAPTEASFARTSSSRPPARSTRPSCSLGPASAARRSASTSGCILCDSSTASSTSRRTPTWCTRSRRTA
jgi:choline dehydrogenase-like flavoprotein